MLETVEEKKWLLRDLTLYSSVPSKWMKIDISIFIISSYYSQPNCDSIAHCYLKIRTLFYYQ